MTSDQQTKFREDGLRDIQEYIDRFIVPSDARDVATLRQATQIRLFVMKCLEHAPLYFWHIPASSTGRYHPKWGLGDGGLVRHTVFGAYMATEFARTFGLSDLHTMLAVSAMFLHDTCKYGIHDVQDMAYFDVHPLLPRLKYAAKSQIRGLQLHKDIPLTWADTIFDAIERHMGNIAKGEWINVGSAARPTLKPENAIEYVVHLSDLVASRKEVYFSDFLPEEIASQIGI